MKIYKLNSNELYTNLVSYSNVEDFINEYYLDFSSGKLLYADHFALKNNSIVLLVKQLSINIADQKINFYKILVDNSTYWIKDIEMFKEI